MSDRVLASGKAKEAIQRMNTIINSDLQGLIRQLLQVGDSLTDRESWDGAKATRFRSDQWPESRKALESARQKLEELKKIADDATNEIMRAGGNR